MSATPRTEANLRGSDTRATSPFAEFTRQLETELAAAWSRNTYLEQQVTAQHERAEKLCDRLAAIEKAAQLPDLNASVPTIGHYAEELRAHALHLAAENLRLRELLQQSARHVFSHAAASHLTEGFHPKRNEWDDLADKLREEGFK